MRVKLKKAVEVPSSIQATVDAVLSSPLSSIAESLRSFAWTYDKGDFTQWVALFNRFDEFFDEYVKPRKDLALKYEPGHPDPPFPEENCLAVLRVTSILLENCSSKHLYSSYEHLSALLAAPSRAVVAAALQTLMSFLKKTHHANIRWQGFKDLNIRLQALAQGWGGKEQGLEMLACVGDHGKDIQQVLATVTSLRYEFYQEAALGMDPAAVPGQVVIQLPATELQQLAAQHGGNHGIMQHLVQQYKVPEQHRYPLFVALCRARDFCSLAGRRHQAGLRMMALVVMAQSHSAADELLSTLGSESELVLELVALVAPVAVPAAAPGGAPGLTPSVPDWLRALAVRCLAVMLQDRGRHTAVISALNGGIGQGGPGMLSTLMQSSIQAYMSSPGPAASSEAAAAQSASQEYERLLEGAKAQDGSDSDFLEALLSFVGALVLSSPGSQVLADAGIVQMLLSMLEDHNPDHLPVVASCVKLLESCMDLSQQAASSYRDLNGLHAVVQRLAHEVGVPSSSGSSGAPGPDGQPADVPMGGDGSSNTADSSSAAAGNAQAGAGDAAGGTAPTSQVPYARKVLIKFLLRAVAISTYSPSGLTIRPQDADSVLLYRCLRTLFEQAPAFGGSLFALAASVMADAIHHDPLCYRALDEAELPDAFIKSVQAGVLPYGEALIAISSALAALCLNTGGLERVKQARMLQVFVPIFTSKKYSKALSGDTPVIVGSGLEELFRFVPQLRPDGAQALADILRGLCILGGDTQEAERAKEALVAWEAQDAARAVAAAAHPADAATAAARPSTSSAEPMETDAAATAAAPGAQPAAEDVTMSSREGEGAAGEAVAPQQETAGVGGGADTAPDGAAEPMAVEQAGQQAGTEGAAGSAPAEAAAAPAPAAPAAEGGDGTAAAAAAPAELPPKPFDFSELIATADKADVEAFLPEAISYTTRMLEGLMTNQETSKAFVEQGGVDLLLRLHGLPKLPYTFGFSASSHALLAVFRQLAPTHAQALSAKTTGALAAAVDSALAHAEQLPAAACVPALPAAERAPWVKLVSATAGLVAIASAVARNTTHMLALVATGPKPVLAQLSKLERALLSQAALADAWAAAREQAERKASALLSAAAKASASKAAAAPDASPAPAAAATPATGGRGEVVMEEEGDEAMQEDVGTAREAQEDMVVAPVGADLGAGGDAAAGNRSAAGEGGAEGDAAARTPTARSSGSRKKTQEELSVDILHHTNVMIRSFYIAMAKSIHTPARRSRDESQTPSLGMRAASMGLATVLLGNLLYQIPAQAPEAVLQSGAAAGVETAISVHHTKEKEKESGSKPGAAAGPSTAGGATSSEAAGDASTMEAGSASAPAGSGAGPKSGLDVQATVAGVAQAVVDNSKSLPLLSASSHLSRLADEVLMILIDTRRGTCHVLILNYFVALGGLKALATRVDDAFTTLFSLLPSAGSSAAGGSGGAAAPGTSTGAAAGAEAADTVMTDSRTPLASSGGAAEAASLAAAAAAPGAAAPGTAAASSSSTLKRDPQSLAQKAVQGFLSVYELLSSAALVLAAPQAAVLLTQPLPPAAGPAASAQVHDPAELMRVVHAGVVEAVAPVWSSDKLAACPPAVMSQVVSVLNRCAEGVNAAASLLLRSRGGAARLPGISTGYNPDPAVVQFLVDMGFSQARAEQALRRVGMNSAEAATEWLLAHPEEPAAAAAGAAAGAAAAQAGAASSGAPGGSRAAGEPARTDEEQLGEALTASLTSIGLSAEQLQPPQAPAGAGASGAAEGTQQAVAPEGAAGAAGAGATPAVGTPVPGAAPASSSKPPTQAATTALLGVDAMVSGAISSMLQTPTDTTTFAMGDLLYTLAVKEKEEGRPPGAVVGALLSHLRGDGSQAAAERLMTPKADTVLLAPTRLLLVVLIRDQPSREAAVSQGLVPVLLELLEAWLQQYQVKAMSLDTTELAASETAAAAARTTLQIPVWVEAALLLVDLLSTTTPKAKASAGAAAAGATTAAALSAAQGGAATEPAPAADAPAAAATAAAAGDVVMTPAGASDAQPPATSTESSAQDKDKKKSTDVLQNALQEVRAAWRPCGMLDDAAQARALQLCITLLQLLHGYAQYWAPSPAELLDAAKVKSQPSPASSTQATLSLLSRLTKRYSNAQVAMSAGVHKLLLSLPPGMWLPTFATVEPYVLVVLRHMMEDPVTLGSWMESEIRNNFTSYGRQRMPGSDADTNGRYMGLQQFLSTMSRVLAREPTVFVETIHRVLVHETPAAYPERSCMLRLRRPTDPPQADSKPGDSTAAAGTATAAGSSQPAAGPSASRPQATATPAAGNTSSKAAGSGVAERAGSTAAPGTKAPSKKHVPGSLVEITDLLIELIMQEDKPGASAGAGAGGSPPATKSGMEVDATSVQPAAADAKGPSDKEPGAAAAVAASGAIGAAAAGASQPKTALQAALQNPQTLLQHLCSYPPLQAWQAMALRLLTDSVLLFGSSVGLLLKRDAELWAKLHPGEPHTATDHTTPHKDGAAAHSQKGGSHTATVAKGGAAGSVPATPAGKEGAAGGREGTKEGKDVGAGKHGTAKAGALLKRLIHTHLVAEDLPLVTHNRAERTAHLLQAICVRSLEGRKRVVGEVVLTLLGQDAACRTATTSSPDQLCFSPEELALALAPVTGVSPLTGASFARLPGRPHPAKARVLVNWVRWLLMGAAEPPSGRAPDPRNSPAHLAAEMARTMHDLGMVKALTAAMRQVMLEHPRSPRTLSVILHSLETLSRPAPMKKQKQAAATAAAAVAGGDQQARAGAAPAGAAAGGQAPSAGAAAVPAGGGTAAAVGSSAVGGDGAGPSAAATPAPPATAAATPMPPGTQVAVTPLDAATGLRAPAGALAVNAVAAMDAEREGDAAAAAAAAGGGRRGARNAVIRMLQALENEAGPGGMLEAMEALEEAVSGEDEDEEGEEGDSLDEGSSMEGDEGDEDDDMEDVHDMADGILPGGMAIELPGGGVLQVVEGEGPEHDSGDEGIDSASDSDVGGEGEDEDDDEHPDARGDIGTDDDEVLDTEEEDEEDEEDHGHPLGEVHDPHDVLLDMDHGEHDEAVLAVGPRPEDGDEDEEGDEEEEDEEEEDEEGGFVGAGQRYDDASIPGLGGIMEDDDLANGGQEYDDDGAGFTDEMEEDVDMVDIGGMDIGNMGGLRRMARTLGSRAAQAATGGLQGGADNDVGTGFGAMADISAESLQAVLPTLTQLLGDTAIGGVLGAARQAGGGSASRAFRIVNRDQHGRQTSTVQGPLFPMGGPYVHSLANTAPPAVTHRLLTRPPTVAPAGQQPAAAGGTGAGGVLRAEFGEDGGAEILLLNSNQGGLNLSLGFRGTSLAQLEQQILGVAGRLSNNTAMEFLERLSMLPGGVAAALPSNMIPGRAPGAAGAAAPTALEETGLDTRALEHALQRVFQGPPQAPVGAAAAPAAGGAAPASTTTAEPATGAGAGAATGAAAAGAAPAPAGAAAATPADLFDQVVQQFEAGTTLGGTSAAAAAGGEAAGAEPGPGAQAAQPQTPAPPPAAAGTAAGATPSTAGPTAPSAPSSLQEALALALEAAVQPAAAAAESQPPVPVAPLAAGVPMASMAAALQDALAAAMGVDTPPVPPASITQPPSSEIAPAQPAASAEGAAAPVTHAPVAPADESAPTDMDAEGPGAQPAGSDHEGEPMSIAEQAVSDPMSTDAGPAAPSSDTAAASAPPAPGSSLNSALRRAAEAAGIDLAFLEALPEELRAEVLTMHGAQVVEEPVPAAPAAAAGGGAPAPVGAAAGGAPSTAATAPAGGAGVEEGLGIDPEFLAALPPHLQAEVMAQQRMEQRRQAAQRAREAEAAARQARAAAAAAAAAAAGPAAGAPPAEGGNAAAAAGGEGAAAGGEGAAGGAGAAAAGGAAPAAPAAAAAGGDEMDLASLLASFPPDVREDVLLTTDETTLASLPAAIREEARVLRARYRANTFQQEELPQHLLGGMGAVLGGMPAPAPVQFQIGRRGAPAPVPVPGARAGGGAAGRGRSELQASMPLDPSVAQRWNQQDEDDRLMAQLPTLVDQQDLAAMVGLLYVSSLPRPPLQRTLLNLCTHAISRKALLRIMMGTIRALTEGLEQPQPGGPEGMEVDQAAAPPAPSATMPVGLPGLNVKVDSTSAPPMLRRVLECITYLVRHSSLVARMLLSLRVPDLATTASHASIEAPGHLPGAASPTTPAPVGRSAAGTGGSTSQAQPGPESQLQPEEAAGPSALSVMLSTLQHPMCQRSTSTLEFVLQLLEFQLRATGYYLTELRLRIQHERRKASEDKGGEQKKESKDKVDPAEPEGPQPMATDNAAPSTNITPPPQPPASTAPTPAPQAQPQPSGHAQAQTPVQAPLPPPSPLTATPQPASHTPQPAAAFGSPFSTGAGAGAAPPVLTPPPAPSKLGTGSAGEQDTAMVSPTATPPAAPSDSEQRLAGALSAARTVLQELPPELLRYPLGLLAQPGLTQAAYSRASSVLRSLADVAPVHLDVLLSELQSRTQELSRSLEQLLSKLAEAGEQAVAQQQQQAAAAGTAEGHSTAPSSSWLQSDSAQLSSIALQGACVLRLLHLLQAYKKQATKSAPAATPQQQQQGQQAQTAAGTGAGAPAAAAAAAAAPAAVGPSSASQVTAGEAVSNAGGAGLPPAAPEASSSTQPATQPSTGETPPDEYSLLHPAYLTALEGAVGRVAGSLEPVWHALSAVISPHIESALQKGAAGDVAAAAGSGAAAASRMLPPGAQQVLPLVESFFVVCSLQGVVPAVDAAHGPQPTTSAASADLGRVASVQLPSDVPAARMSSAGVMAGGSGRSILSPSTRHADLAFTRFAERHRSLLNAYLRRSPTLLETSLQPLLHVPKLIEFDNKRAYFRAKVRQWDEQQGGGRPYGSLRLTVRREHVFEDSFHQLRSRSPEELRMKLSITFQGEEGIDAGGVTREWYQVMAREVFNLNLALFVQVPEGGSTFQPNPNSIVQSDRGVNHLDYFRFVGRVVGKALHDGQLIDAYFTRSFYKHLLGQPLTYEDIEGVDPEYYKNLLWMLQNDITDLLELTFTAESDFFGRKEVVELVPGGKEVKVTEANKRQYVDLIARHRMTTSIKHQIAAFTQGFWELVPRHLISIFNDHELELLISGLPDIDLSDLRAHTEYQGFTPTAPAIRWFWEVVNDLNKEDKALLIQFVTGTSKVPLEGFQALQGIGGPQKFQIHKAYGASENRLPSAHTCFNQLDLPEYESKEVLRERLLMAIHEGATGFGFG